MSGPDGKNPRYSKPLDEDSYDLTPIPAIEDLHKTRSYLQFAAIVVGAAASIFFVNYTPQSAPYAVMITLAMTALAAYAVRAQCKQREAEIKADTERVRTQHNELAAKYNVLVDLLKKTQQEYKDLENRHRQFNNYALYLINTYHHAKTLRTDIDSEIDRIRRSSKIQNTDLVLARLGAIADNTTMILLEIKDALKKWDVPFEA